MSAWQEQAAKSAKGSRKVCNSGYWISQCKQWHLTRANYGIQPNSCIQSHVHLLRYTLKIPMIRYFNFMYDFKAQMHVDFSRTMNNGWWQASQEVISAVGVRLMTKATGKTHPKRVRKRLQMIINSFFQVICHHHQQSSAMPQRMCVSWKIKLSSGLMQDAHLCQGVILHLLAWMRGQSHIKCIIKAREESVC